jgi:lactate dehydrogenase-like 2-hydroxyacid dehydrogenase
MTDRKPRVLATRHFPPDVEARLAANFDARLNPEDKLYDGPALVKATEGFDGIMCAAGDPLNADTIGKLPGSVRMIATFSVGYEHVDVAAAAKRGILVSNTPDVLTDATADIAMLCMLGAARRTHEGTTMLRTHNWIGWEPTQLMGVHVTGKRLGILGMGRIGQALARRAAGFGMTVLYHNRSQLPEATERSLNARYVSKAELLEQSDHLLLVLPYGPESHHAIGAAELSQMKSTATLVNLARGGIVDDAALAKALREKRIFAAGLDVFEGEPEVHPDLLTVPNVVLTPHIASASEKTRRAMAMLAADNLIAALDAGPQAGHPPSVINPEVMPRRR